MTGRIVAGLSALLQLAACGVDDASQSSVGDVAEPGFERRLELDRILAGSGEELTFGAIGHITRTPSGELLVQDIGSMASVGVVRLGADGAFLDSLGRRGEGPGEYRYPNGMVALPDGRILVRDNSPPTMLVFDESGRFLDEWPLRDLIPKPSWVEMVFTPRTDTSFVVSAMVGTASVNEAETDFAFYELGVDGQVLDSVRVPSTPWDPTTRWGSFHPQKLVAWHPDGSFVVGVSNEYHFDIVRPDTSIRVTRAYEPVPVSPAERAAFDIEMQWRARRGSRFNELIPEPPEFKAAYHRILVAETGEIWVFRHGTGEEYSEIDIGWGLMLPLFREPLRVDVFGPDGGFLGTIDGSGAITPRVVRGDTVWATLRGELDEETLVRFVVR